MNLDLTKLTFWELQKLYIQISWEMSKRTWFLWLIPICFLVGGYLYIKIKER